MLKLMASAFSGFSCRVVAKVPVPVPMSCPQTVGAKSSAEERERERIDDMQRIELEVLLLFPCTGIEFNDTQDKQQQAQQQQQ